MEQKENNEPKINIFNEDIKDWGKDDIKEVTNNKHDKHCHHCKNSGPSIWGLILLFVGVCLLLNNMGLISRDIWFFVLPFWPIILILIGIKIILGKNRISSWIGFILAIILLSVIFFNALLDLRSKNLRDSYPIGHFSSFYIINR